MDSTSTHSVPTLISTSSTTSLTSPNTTTTSTTQYELLSPLHKSSVAHLLNVTSISDREFDEIVNKFLNLRLGDEHKIESALENALHTLKHLLNSDESSPLQLSSYLEQIASASPDRVQKLIQQLQFENSKRHNVNIRDIDLTSNVLLDIEYSLHYIPRSKANHQAKWEYYLNLVFEGGRVERIVCDISELEDFLAKLQDACKEIDRAF